MAWPLHAAVTDSTGYKHRPFQFTFLFPPLSTNWVQNPRIVNGVSLNMFVGISGGVDYFEAASFMNVNRFYQKGVQVSGFGNVVGGRSSGLQLAGFVNVAGQAGHGVHLAGFGNVAGEGVTSLQGAGFFNVADGVKGVQAAGFINIAGNVKGVQAAGFGNVAGDGTTSFQGAGFFNVAGGVKGAQVAGFANIAGHVEGVQVAGFLNICDSIDGIPLGFINVVRKNGYRRFAFSVSEIQYVNLSFKMGVRRLYNIYSFGKPFGPASRWMYGFGLGSEFDLHNKMVMNIEATTHQELWFSNPASPAILYIDRTNMYNTLKVLFGWNMEEKVFLHVGPTFNISVSDKNPYQGRIGYHEIPFYSVFDHTGPGLTNVQMWFGLQGSISF